MPTRYKNPRPLNDGVMFSHYKVAPAERWIWPNFTPYEMACRKTGELYWHPRTFDAAQRARDTLRQPLKINSAHRSWLWNIAVGGAVGSAHLYVALDISTRKHNLKLLYTTLRKSGFKSFGFYQRFIHADLRPDCRMWYGDKVAKMQWQPIVEGVFMPDVEL